MALRRYVPSGRSGPLAIPAVLGAAVLAGGLVGVIEGVVSRWFALFFVFPLLIGAVAGAAAAGMIGKFKLRAPMLALILAFLGGSAGYAAEQVTVYLQFRAEISKALKDANPTASDTEVAAHIDGLLTQEVGAPGFVGFLKVAAREGVSIKRMSASDPNGLKFTGTAAWILWGVELLVCAVVAGGIAFVRAREPFCEACDAWYGEAVPLASGGAGEKAAHAQMMAALDRGDPAAAAAAFHAPRQGRTHHVFHLGTRSCARCGGDVYLRLDRVTPARKAQRKKLDAWLATSAERDQLKDALDRAPRAA